MLLLKSPKFLTTNEQRRAQLPNTGKDDKLSVSASLLNSSRGSDTEIERDGIDCIHCRQVSCEED